MTPNLSVNRIAFALRAPAAAYVKLQERARGEFRHYTLSRIFGRLLELTPARDRAGQYSIRINDQFRLCFRWVAGNAEDVEIVDYHY